MCSVKRVARQVAVKPSTASFGIHGYAIPRTTTEKAVDAMACLMLSEAPNL